MIECCVIIHTMKDKQSASKNALPRIYAIDRKITGGKYPNIKTLAEDYEISTATISRDIEFMRTMLNAPIEYDYKRRGYYYTEKTFRIPAAFSSAGEMLALGMAKNLLSLYKNTPIYGSAKQLVESLTTPLGETEKPRWYEDRVIVPPIPSVSFEPEIWRIVCEGLRKNQALTFEYRAAWKDAYSGREVHPYQLLFDNGSWYLYAFNKKQRGIRMYSLCRIKNIRLTNETFKFPAAADFRTCYDGSFLGAYASEKKYRFRIAFYNDAAMRVCERRWTADQRVTKTSGGIILTFTSAQYGKVLELVLSNGKDALPLEPKILVDEWKENIAGMQKLAKSLKK